MIVSGYDCSNVGVSYIVLYQCKLNSKLDQDDMGDKLKCFVIL